MPVQARQVVVTEPYKVAVREVTLPDPGPRQILVAADASAISAGTELAVYTGTHQWLKDPNLPDWKFPFKSGYSAAGKVVAIGTEAAEITGFKAGDPVSYPGNHASHELLTLGQRRANWPITPWPSTAALRPKVSPARMEAPSPYRAIHARAAFFGQTPAGNRHSRPRSCPSVSSSCEAWLPG